MGRRKLSEKLLRECCLLIDYKKEQCIKGDGIRRQNEGQTLGLSIYSKQAVIHLHVYLNNDDKSW